MPNKKKRVRRERYDRYSITGDNLFFESSYGDWVWESIPTIVTFSGHLVKEIGQRNVSKQAREKNLEKGTLARSN